MFARCFFPREVAFHFAAKAINRKDLKEPKKIDSAQTGGVVPRLCAFVSSQHDRQDSPWSPNIQI